MKQQQTGLKKKLFAGDFVFRKNIKKHCKYCVKYYIIENMMLKVQMNRRIDAPIIHIIGLPGAGKTTLGKQFAKKFNLPVFRIGEYRSKFPESITHEADAWVALFHDLSKRRWKNCILETTGLNHRELFLRTALPMSTKVTIKLMAQRKVLYARIKKKDKNEQGNSWLFSKDYRDKYEFVRKMYKDLRMIPADIVIDTTKLREKEVFKIALEKLRMYI